MVVPGISDIPVHEFESFVIVFDVFLQPGNDGLMDFDPGRGRKRQIAVDEFLREPHPAAHSSGQCVEDGLAGFFDAIPQYIRRIALKVRRHRDGL
jgi:hypothetical protein